jgi:hypothetical protein
MPEYLAETDCVVADPSTTAFAKAVGKFLENDSFRRSAGKTGESKALAQYAPNICSSKYLSFIRDCL